MSPPHVEHEQRPTGRDRELYLELARLSWPIAISMVSYSVMTLVDTLFVSRLGTSALAATGLGGIAAFTVICFGVGHLRSVKVAIAQADGAGRTGDALPLLGAGLTLALVMGLVSLVAGVVAALALPALSAGEHAGDLARQYVQIRSLAAPGVLIAVALREARYGLGDSKTPMVAALCANVLNVPLNALLIFGAGLGVAGAAVATVAAQAVELILLLAPQRRLGFGLRAFGRRHITRLWRLGVPLGLEFLLSISAFAVLVLLVARMSEVDLAAHQIALQVIHFSFLPAVAVGEAASVIAGNAVGAGRDHEVRRVARSTLVVVTAYMGFCALLFAIFAAPIGNLFSRDPAVQELAAKLLYVAAAFQLFDGAGLAARSVLRGAGDVRFAAIVMVAAAWICTPPLTLLLGFWAGLGALGGWLALVAEIIVGSALLWDRLLRNRWLSAAQRSREETLADGPGSEPYALPV
jgi:MATE family multidrug resistance protein